MPDGISFLWYPSGTLLGLDGLRQGAEDAALDIHSLAHALRVPIVITIKEKRCRMASLFLWYPPQGLEPWTP